MRRLRLPIALFSITALTILAAVTADASGTAHYRHERGWALNDLHATPGVTLPVSAMQVCVRGYSASVRNVSTATKNRVYAEYGITHHVAYQYEIDHLISLELGGSNDIRNLWPQPNDHARNNTKDGLEDHLHSLVCNGRLSLKTAQHAIAADWVKAYATYYKQLPNGHQAGTSSSTTTAPTSSPTAAPTTAPASSGPYMGGPYTTGCTPDYPDFCIPYEPGDYYNCADIGRKDFRSTGSDPYRVDGDHDGVACES